MRPRTVVMAAGAPIRARLLRRHGLALSSNASLQVENDEKDGLPRIKSMSASRRGRSLSRPVA